jgi:hypothetical protein
MIGVRCCRWLFSLIPFWMVFTFLLPVAQGIEPQTVEITSPLPYGPAPIDYFSESDDNVIQRLQTRLDNRELQFKPRLGTGYLLDLLHALAVPVESQTLVFSKTSVNQALIRPAAPRAIYFNDEITVGWVPAAAAIEITLQDAVKGTVFYTLPQSVDLAEGDAEADSHAPETSAIRLRRDGRCIACHVSARTLNVPGHIVSSFLTDSKGQPREGYSSINHSTDFRQRWGGWYVTGRAPNLIHWGNLIGDADVQRHKQDPEFRGVVDDLSSLVDLTRYPSPHSDAVALLVLNHQMHFYNLVNRVSFEHRLNRRSNAEELLVRYALMQDQAALAGPVSGSTRYAELFQAAGTDASGRSLRELDLKDRVFVHDLSPFILSSSFQSLPAEVKARLYERLNAELVKRADPVVHGVLKAVIAEGTSRRHREELRD